MLLEPEEGLDCMSPLITIPVDKTKTKGLDTIQGPTSLRLNDIGGMR